MLMSPVEFLKYECLFVTLMSCIACSGSSANATTKVHFIVPMNYRGKLLLIHDPQTGVHPLVGDSYVVRFSNAGIAWLDDFSVFEGLHVLTAEYENGESLPNANYRRVPSDTVAIHGGSTFSMYGQSGAKRAREYYVATLPEYLGRGDHENKQSDAVYSIDLLNETYCAAAGNGWLAVWKFPKLDRVWRLEHRLGNVTHIGLVNDDSLVAQSTGDLRIYSLISKDSYRFPKDNDLLTFQALCQDGSLLVVGNATDAQLEMWEISTSQLLREIHGVEEPSRAVAAVNKNRKMAVSTEGKSDIRIVDVQYDVEQRFAVGSERVDCMAFDQDGKKLGVATQDGSVSIVSVDSADKVASFETRGLVRSLDFVPHTELMVILRDSLEIWNWQNGELVELIAGTDGQRGEVRDFAVTKEGILAFGMGTTIHIWNVRERKELRTLDVARRN